MVLLSLTASHRELDLDALERLSSGSASVGRAVVGSCGPVQGSVVISTCNRFELYLDVDAPLDGDAVRHATGHVAELVAASSGVSTPTAAESFTVRTGPEVTEHLFTVASGLDSMVVGEREIAGQVKRSLAEAREDGTTSKTLELLFQTASRTSKQVGTRTALGAAGRSVVSLGLDLAERDLMEPAGPRWQGARVVLIGTGSYAGASVAALRARGCTDVRVYSQSGRAEQFAASHDVVAVPAGPAGLLDALADADVVVSCSGARGRRPAAAALAVEPDGTRPEASLEYVLDAAAVVRARERAAALADDPQGSGRRETGAPLIVLDLALHRDVDPRVADVEGVALYDLGTLKAHAPAAAAGVAEARRIVDGAAAAFEETRLGRAADAAVVALLDEAEGRIRAEVEDAAARLTAELASRGETPDATDLDAIARDVRRRVHTALHSRIVEVRATALAAARAQEAAVVAGAEALVTDEERSRAR